MHQRAENIPLNRTEAALFSLRDVTYSYVDGLAALAGIDLEIYPGDRLALTGHNGSGKTSLAKLLNGLLHCQQGSLTYKGQPLEGDHLHQTRLEIGLLFQDPDDQLFCNTLMEDVQFGLLNQGLSPAAAEAAAVAALEAAGLLDKAGRPPHHLSHGQRKRAALAALLAMDPQVLILDEPTTNLDPRHEELLLQQLQDYPGTLVCITHNLLFAHELCERALVLEHGRIHHDFTLKELVAHQPSLRGHGLDFSFRFSGAFPADPSWTNDVNPGDNQQKEPSSDAEPLIRLHDYSYTYPDGRQALAGLDLRIQAGDALAIVGENGAGKSTLAAGLAGLRSGEGRYLLNGQEMTGHNRQQLCRSIGLVFQNSADQLFCPSCREEVAFGPRQMGLSKIAINQRVKQALQQVNLNGFENRVPLHLSGGERKRLALAAVLAMQPDILILDEPTAGLDPQGEAMLLDVLADLDVTLLLISHDLFFIRRLTQRTLVLHEGRIVQDYATDDFFNDANLTSLNQLDYTYRSRCELEIRQLQQGFI